MFIRRKLIQLNASMHLSKQKLIDAKRLASGHISGQDGSCPDPALGPFTAPIKGTGGWSSWS